MSASIWSTARRGQPSGTVPSSQGVRTAFEQDYDRVLFSTAVRRLADKTQVFPLERNDSVRTRLTHSLEVSNFARSLANRIQRNPPEGVGPAEYEHAPVLLATAGLAHDLGNPPFGHQGEASIAKWFEKNEQLLEPLPSDRRTDFQRFEGNAQGFRLLTKLQDTLGDHGLDLTAATLAVVMKYTVGSSETSGGAAARKHGFFASEREEAEWVSAQTGVPRACRHPLAWIVEAADDVAYSTLDIEDTIKKGLVSSEDVLAYLRGKFDQSTLAGLTNTLTQDFKRADGRRFPLSRVREVKASYLRTHLVAHLLTGAQTEFVNNIGAINAYEWKTSLLESSSDASQLCTALKEFARMHAYNSTGVLALEAKGDAVVNYLMDKLWDAITNRKDPRKLNSRRTTAASAYVYSLISESYRWHFERTTDLPSDEEIRYRELQLLSDMISGMTDGFALDIYERVKSHVN